MILEWIDANDTDVLVLLRMEENDKAASNRLMHHGYGGRNDNGRRSWAQTSIAWTVSTFENLKALFGAARHLLGLFELPVADALTLYCKTSPRNSSREAYFSRFCPCFN